MDTSLAITLIISSRATLGENARLMMQLVQENMLEAGDLPHHSKTEVAN